MIAIIFSIMLFFIAIYFLFRAALVTAAAIMGFSLLWYLIGYMYHRYDSMIDYISKGGNS